MYTLCFSPDDCSMAVRILLEEFGAPHDSTLNVLPTNNCRITGCHAFKNDGAGLKFGPYVNGNMINGGAYENNYWTGGNNVGYNIELLNTSSFTANEFTDVWCEGPVQSHIYMNAVNVHNRFNRFNHFANGAAGNVDRAAICIAGTLQIDSPFGQNAAYTTIGGSSSPFRVTTLTADTFVDGNVNTGTDRITVTTHPLVTNQAVTLTTSGTLPAGLALSTTYYIREIDANTIEFYSDAALANIVDITAAAGGGTHTITPSSSGSIHLTDPTGSTLTDAGPWIEDQLNATTGFYNNVRQNNRTWTYGDQIHRSTTNGLDASYYNETSTFPAITVDVFNQAIRYGDGTAAGLPIPNLGIQSGTVTIPSATTIAPAQAVVQVSGSTTIATITAPYANFRGVIHIIPAAGSTWVTNTAGNIALATTAVPLQLLTLAYDATASAWYPSYT